MSKEKKNKNTNSISQTCRTFSDENTTDLVKKFPALLVMSEEKIKKHKNGSFFFSSGTFSARRRNRGPKNIMSVALFLV